MSAVRTRVLLLAAGAALGLLGGCHKDATEPAGPAGGGPPMAGGPPPGKVFDADSEPHAAGMKVMVSSGCFRCHAVDGARPAGGMPGMPGPGGPPKSGPGGPPKFGPGGPGGPGRGGMGGPDLAHVGQNPVHTTDWLAQVIQNPKAVNPGAKMPAFDGKMSEGDLKELVEYLASLK